MKKRDWYFNNNQNKTTHMRVLVNQLNYYTKLYDEGNPAISDKEWDDLYFELEKLEKETGIIYATSPIHKINYDVVSKLLKTVHSSPMLSLDKTKDPAVVQSFVSGHPWLGMFKMDGLTIRLTYIDGKLVKAETRGNGEEGEDVTHNAFVVRNIPKTIPNIVETIVDGEIISTIENFEDFATEYKNPRNFASGSIRLLDSKECSKRNLIFVAWDLVSGSDEDFFMYRLEQLDYWGFTTVPRVGDAETVEDAIIALNKDKDRAIYPIDGYVFKFESVSYGKTLGRTAHHWNNAIAFKFYNEEYETTLLDIEWSMGRTGQLTPVAIYEPIEIDGTECSRASLHNLSVMNNTLGIYPYKGQFITVYKANEIIPQIGSADKTEANIDWDNLIKITSCPICGGELEVEDNDGVLTVWCGNPSCQGKLLNRIDHFCGKKGLDIKGISKATIEKLIDWGWVNELNDIFNLETFRKDWENKPGFGKASVNKILCSINEGRKTDLVSFISSLGIPLVGRTIAKEIIKYYNTWEDFRQAVGDDWTVFDGFGPEISKSINNFDYTEADKIAGLLIFTQNEIQQEGTPASAIKDKTFCVTGKLQNYTRDSIKAEIESLGGKVTSSVTAKTDYLITNTPDSGTTKNRDAQKLGVKIITEQDYLNMKGKV